MPCQPSKQNTALRYCYTPFYHQVQNPSDEAPSSPQQQTVVSRANSPAWSAFNRYFETLAYRWPFLIQSIITRGLDSISTNSTAPSGFKILHWNLRLQLSKALYFTNTHSLCFTSVGAPALKSQDVSWSLDTKSSTRTASLPSPSYCSRRKEGNFEILRYLEGRWSCQAWPVATFPSIGFLHWSMRWTYTMMIGLPDNT